MSYGMLFNWARPSIYIPTLIGGPTFQLFFFAALGSYATDRSPAYFAIGNAIQVSCLAGVFGMTMAIANERWFGTLPALLATPANRVAVFAGRFLPFVFNGLLVSLYALGIGIVFLGVRLDTSSLAVVGLALLTTVFSCTAIGALQGAISLRLRDGLFGANMIMMGILLFCGVNIPLADLPRWMQVVGHLLPFTHGLEAVRQAADGAGLRPGRRPDRPRGPDRHAPTPWPPSPCSGTWSAALARTQPSTFAERRPAQAGARSTTRTSAALRTSTQMA